MVSIEQQHESTLGLFTHVPSCLNIPPPLSPSHPSRLLGSWFEFPESFSKFPLAVCFTYGNVCFQVLSPYLPPSPSSPQLCPQVCSRCLCLCSANISTIFLGSMYMCWYLIIVCLFLGPFVLVPQGVLGEECSSPGEHRMHAPVHPLPPRAGGHARCCRLMCCLTLWAVLMPQPSWCDF